MRTPRITASDWSLGVVNFPEMRLILVEDLDTLGRRSVTNDAEDVLAAINEVMPIDARTRVIYKDSAGQWDQLLYDATYTPQPFRGFRGLDTTDLEVAIEKVRGQ